jgi:hypothetical protein
VEILDRLPIATRCGRSNPVDRKLYWLPAATDAAPFRAKRQLGGVLDKIFKSPPRWGRSVSEIIEPTGTDYESIDAAPSSTKYQTQLQYGGNRPGRSLKDPAASNKRQI